jgi:DNA-binding PadR family transcriptional regulator
MVLRYAILALLDGQELHGYRIKSAFEEQIGPLWPLNFGQIYQTLKDLRRGGLIEGRFDRGTGHVGRWMYTITAKGRRALDTWLGRTPRHPQPARDEILIRLLGRKDLASRLDQLKRQEEVYRQYSTNLTAQRGTYGDDVHEHGILKTLAADAAIFEAEARLRWIAHCAKVLEHRLGAVSTLSRRGDRAPKVKARANG